MKTKLIFINNDSQTIENNTITSIYNSPINTSVAGLPVPILYGERMVGSVVISAGINVMKN